MTAERDSGYAVANPVAQAALNDFWHAYARRNRVEMRRANIRLLQAYLPHLDYAGRCRTLRSIARLEALIAQETAE